MTILISFLGCKVNSYEVEAVAETFLKNGFSFFDEKKDDSPTVIILNTCAVTKTSVTKDKKEIKQLRKKYPTSCLVVMGCYAQFGYKEIEEKYGADIVIGTSNREKIFELVTQFLKDHKKSLYTTKITTLKNMKDYF